MEKVAEESNEQTFLKHVTKTSAQGIYGTYLLHLRWEIEEKAAEESMNQTFLKKGVVAESRGRGKTATQHQEEMRAGKTSQVL